MVGDLTRPVSYKTMLGRMCLGAMLVGVVIDKVNSSFHELCTIAFKTNSVKTFVFWDLGVAAVGGHLW